MAGHSKWASIKRKKAATDAKRGAAVHEATRAIQVAARDGGGDPAGNAALANAIEKAKDAGCPRRTSSARSRRGRARTRTPRRSRPSSTRATGRAAWRSCRGAHRQPQPHRVRGAPRVLQERRQPRRTGSVAWVFEKKGVIVVDAARDSEDDLLVGDRRRRRGRLDRRERLRGRHRPGGPRGRARPSTTPASSSTPRSSPCGRRTGRGPRGPGRPAHAPDRGARGARRRERRACELRCRRDVLERVAG